MNRSTGYNNQSLPVVSFPTLEPREGDSVETILQKLLLKTGGGTASGATEAQQAQMNNGINDLNSKVATAITEVSAAKDAITTGNTQNHTDLLALLTQLQTQFGAVDGIEALLTGNGAELMLIKQSVADTLTQISQFRTENATGLATLNASTQQVLNAIPTQTTALVTAMQGLFTVEVDIGTSTVVAPATAPRLIERSVAINKTTLVRSAPVYREVNSGALITDGTVFDTSLTTSQQIQYTETVIPYVDQAGNIVARKRLVYKINSDGTPSALVGETITDANGAVIPSLDSTWIEDNDVSLNSSFASPVRIAYSAYKFVVTKTSGSNLLVARLNPETTNNDIGADFNLFDPFTYLNLSSLVSLKFTVIKNTIPNFRPLLNVVGYMEFAAAGQEKVFARPRLDIPMANEPQTAHHTVLAGSDRLTNPQLSDSGVYEIIAEASYLRPKIMNYINE